MQEKITIEQAIEKAKKRNANYNTCIEHANAWAFSRATGEEQIGGADAGVVVMKEDGRMLNMYEYYMSDVGESDIISERSI